MEGPGDLRKSVGGVFFFEHWLKETYYVSFFLYFVENGLLKTWKNPGDLRKSIYLNIGLKKRTNVSSFYIF